MQTLLWCLARVGSFNQCASYNKLTKQEGKVNPSLDALQFLCSHAGLLMLKDKPYGF